MEDKQETEEELTWAYFTLVCRLTRQKAECRARQEDHSGIELKNGMTGKDRKECEQREVTAKNRQGRKR